MGAKPVSIIGGLGLVCLFVISCGQEAQDADADATAMDTGVFDMTGLPEQLAPDEDPDGDGFTTTQELAYGTDPHNPGSHPPDQDGDKLPDPEDEDIDGDGVLNAEDAFPYNPEETLDSDGDGQGDNQDLDDDGDGYTDALEAEYGTDPLNSAVFPADLDGDGVPDKTDPDMDGDGVTNDSDAFPENSLEWADNDGDGTGDNADEDDDDDGYSDEIEDQYGTDPTDSLSSPADLDGDGIPDSEDLDKDGDGVDNVADAFPNEPAEWADTDSDGQGDNADADDDNDGYLDAVEEKLGTDPLSAQDKPADLDGDLLPDGEDTDIDGDGVLNAEDAFPMDPKESVDTDGDGVGDKADFDDDGDGYPDLVEVKFNTNPTDPEDKPEDVDGDGVPDTQDLDLDGDGVLNESDAFPFDPDEWADLDGDGVGNNGDGDDDGDGYPDTVEQELGFDPADANSHPKDQDGDGVPDEADDDVDGDGVENNADAFPFDPSETSDFDEDGMGDNGDADDDNDGFSDQMEEDYDTDPKDSQSHPADLDQDGKPDDEDSDIDGDGVVNQADAFPFDPAETVDTDADGTGDNADLDDDNDGYSDAIEGQMGTDAKDSAVHPTDLDGDGVPDPVDNDVDGDGAPNGDDHFPLDPKETLDSDSDGQGDNADKDDDDDGYPDEVEKLLDTDPLDPDSYPDDVDGDGLADSLDPDIDGDGIANPDDAFPADADEWKDTDGDGVGNNADLDDDGDGFHDQTEKLFQTDPESPFSYPADMDGDKIPDGLDPDIDGDGVENALDAFPANPLEIMDTDGDGTGNNTDPDDDGDGFPDSLEIELGYDPLDYDSQPGDLDGDGIPDISDPDIDGDGVENGPDQFPGDPTEWDDLDGDGVGNNSDPDDDGDGYPDLLEIDYETDPLDPASIPADLDGDLIPDDADIDIDGDLVKNDLDAFPLDPAEWFDTDNDGLGNNADPDDDDDGYLDAVEMLYNADPLDALSFPPDIDGDLIPDPEDPDMDGDGVPNIDDAFPKDPDAWEEVLDDSSFGSDYQDAIPPDADPEAFDTKKFSLVRGTILDPGEVAIEGVAVSVLEHPEYGSVTTDENGEFTIPVNGGSTLTLHFEDEDFTPAQRFVEVPWNDIVVIPEVQLVNWDPVQSQVFLNGDPDDVQVHTSVASEHPVTVALKGDNLLVGETDDGELILTDTAVISATEYENPDQMPGELPSTSEFTYCVDLKVEGFKNVEFDQPVLLWTRNFLDFEVGTIVPTGYYDREDGKWKPMEDGVVVRLLDDDGDGLVDSLDWDDDGLPDDLDLDGDLADEVAGIDLELDAEPLDTYWRVPVIHFSPVDCNWPASGPPPDAEPPPETPPEVDNPDDDPDEDDPCRQGGYSEVDVRARILHESIPVPGTDMALHYSSSWVPGYQIPVDIGVSGPSVPASLESISVNYSIAGRAYSEELPPEPDQQIHYLWDGRDFMGNLVNQRMKFNVEVGYKYPASYYSSQAAAESVGASFAAMGVEATNINAYRPVTLWRRYEYPVYHFRPEVPANAWSTGRGWTPDVVNYYDGTSQSVLLGDGRKVRGDQFGVEVDAVTKVPLSDSIRSLGIDSDGVIYYLPGGNPAAEKKVMRLVAGKPVEEYVSMDGRIGDIAIGPDDNLYLTVGAYLWKVPRKTGVPFILAGLYLQFFNCFAYYGNYCLLNLDVDVWGYVFLISRYPAAVGASAMVLVAPDGSVLANQVELGCASFDISVGAKGTVVAACKNGPIKQVGRDGSVTDMPGWAPGCSEFYGYTDPTGVEVLKDGSVLVADQACNRVRKILPDGTVTVLAGTGKAGYSGDGAAPLAAELTGPTDVLLGPDDAIYFADSGNKRIRKIQKVKSAVDLGIGQYGVPLQTGEILVFGEKLEHLATRDMYSGVQSRTMFYDDLGRLTTVQSAGSRQILFDHDAQGRVTQITGWDGQKTGLTYDPDGDLVAVDYEDGTGYQFKYLDSGLLTRKTDPGDGVFNYKYDQTGRISKSEDPIGGWVTYDYKVTDGTATATTLTAQGKITSYEDVLDSEGNWTSVVTAPAGGVTTYTTFKEEWSEEAIRPDGTLVVRKTGTDEKYGTRYTRYESRTTPGGLSKVVQLSRTWLDGLKQLATTTATNGAVLKTVVDQDDGVVTVTTPEARVSTVEFDINTGLLLDVQRPGVVSGQIEYDETGNPTTYTWGQRITQMEYDDNGRLSRMVTPMNAEYRFNYGQIGLLTSVERPDGSSISYEYDDNGMLVTVTGPGGESYSYVRNGVEQVTSYATPEGLTWLTGYDLDRDWISTQFPSGAKAEAKLMKGLLTSITVGDEVTWFTYPEDGSLRVKSATAPSGVTNSYTYDGPLQISAVSTGPVVGSVTFDYDDNFRRVVGQVNDLTVEFSHDNDGLLTAAGDLSIDRNDESGAVETVGDGFLTVTYERNEYGEVGHADWSFGGVTLYSNALDYDLDGRISRRVEIIDGETVDREYGRDAMGQLVSVKNGGVLVEEYAYDAAGNRTQATSPALGAGEALAQFDSDGRMQSQGQWTFSYDANGRLNGRSFQGVPAVQFSYADNGELRKVTFADGGEVCWQYDAFGRAAVRLEDGEVTHKYLYWDQLRPAAILAPDNSVLAMFVYAGGRVPVYMDKGGKRYYFVTDDLGTVRLVVDGAGTIVQRLDYDTFGNVVSVENPDFDAYFGFAGGLTDPETDLVRFRFRDYVPQMGRWAGPDPLGPMEGFNIYRYAWNDPASLVDPLGLTEKADEVKDIVEGKGVPGGVIPDNVTDYKYDEKTGKAELKLEKGFTVQLPDDEDGNKQTLTFKDKLTCKVEDGKITGIKGIKYKGKNGASIHTVEKVDDSTVRFTGSGLFGIQGSKDIKIDELPALPPKK